MTARDSCGMATGYPKGDIFRSACRLVRFALEVARAVRDLKRQHHQHQGAQLAFDLAG